MGVLPGAEFNIVSSRSFFVGPEDDGYVAPYNGEESWLNERSETITRITGELADVLRSYFGRSGDVAVREIGEAGGYSEVTQEWSYDASLTIGNETVLSRNGHFDTYEYRDRTTRGSGVYSMPQLMGDIVSIARSYRG